MPAPDPDVLARLAVTAQARGGVFFRRDALAAGLTDSQVRTLVRRGSWLSIGHGALTLAGPDAVAVHALACAARLLAVPAGAVVSHASAGVLHGLPYVDPPAVPTLLLPRTGDVEHLEGIASARLPASHLEVRHDVPVTSVGRTAVDLLRGAPDDLTRQALADGFLQAGVDGAEVESVLADCSGWPGVALARDAWDFASALSESPLESRCRVWFRDGDLPCPEQQVRVIDETGRIVARTDFLFRAQRTIVEADGKMKYQWSQALWDEKRREDRLRELGFEVVRATWDDCFDGGTALVQRVLRAFERSARRAA